MMANIAKQMRAIGIALLWALCLAPGGSAAQPHPRGILTDEPAPPFAPGEFGEEGIADDPWHVRVDYLLWWLRDVRVPPLLTTGPPASGGVLGQPGVAVLYGQDKIETERHAIPGRHLGFRATAGCWLDEGRTWGLEASCFFLERDSSDFKAESAGDRLLARPFVNALDGSQSAEIIAGFSPGVGLRTGRFNAFTKIELFGQELNLVVPVAGGPDYRLDLLAGCHFLQMRERLDLTATGKLLPDQAILFGVSDHLRTHNQFYGGQFGLSSEYTAGRWYVNWRGVVALGGTHQVLKAKGDRTLHSPAARTVQPFGLYVLPTNRGESSNIELDVVSEIGVQLGYQWTDHCRTHVGYTLLYWTNPVRPGDQIDSLNLRQTAGDRSGPARPAVLFRDDYFWAQGLHAGLQLRW
jgi:hypothetical protein